MRAFFGWGGVPHFICRENVIGDVPFRKHTQAEKARKKVMISPS